MRLAIGWAARDRSRDARCEMGVEQVDIETDVEHALSAFHLIDDAADQNADAELVDLAHVRKTETAIAQQTLFHTVDRTHAEQLEPIRINRCPRLFAEKTIEPGLAAEESRRHAMHVGGKRGRWGVVVRMRIEPQHEKLAAGFAPVASDPIHRTHRERVVAS